MVTTHFGLKSDNSKGTTNEKYFFSVTGYNRKT